MQHTVTEGLLHDIATLNTSSSSAGFAEATDVLTPVRAL